MRHNRRQRVRHHVPPEHAAAVHLRRRGRRERRLRRESHRRDVHGVLRRYEHQPEGRLAVRRHATHHHRHGSHENTLSPNREHHGLQHHISNFHRDSMHNEPSSTGDHAVCPYDLHKACRAGDGGCPRWTRRCLQRVHAHADLRHHSSDGDRSRTADRTGVAHHAHGHEFHRLRDHHHWWRRMLGDASPSVDRRLAHLNGVLPASSGARRWQRQSSRGLTAVRIRPVAADLHPSDFRNGHYSALAAHSPLAALYACPFGRRRRRPRRLP
jgi:hypothetical protein